MVLIYIAGAFRAPTAWEIEQNVRRAEEMGARVIQAGGYPVIPHANTRFFHGYGPDVLFLEGTAELLRRCDGLIMLDGWEESSDSVAERYLASVREIPILEQGEFWDRPEKSLRLWIQKLTSRRLSGAVCAK